MAACIMLMGTSSHVGKSILTTALCRIFHQEGRHVVPFKAQNMALNSYVTADGDEMGRAQVAQAEAAGLLPFVDMNPVLLKPTGDARSQVILMGKPVGNLSAKEYHRGYSLKAFGAVQKALQRLQANYDTIIIEGAGSPAEINLKANDIVNMRVAKYLQAPVLLIADIDRGGALASLVGTLELLDPDERALVKGLIINKFRGDVSLLTPALDFLEQKTGKPVLGVVPYLQDLGIDEEDSVSLDEKEDTRAAELRLVVVRTPKISNFTDFDILAHEPDVSLCYAQKPEDLQGADLILLPGSKNTSEDLLWLQREGFAEEIQSALKQGVPIIGICGGYQMLGEKICDPHHAESDAGEVQGLGILGTVTTFHEKKATYQVKARCESLPFLGKNITMDGLEGYEIHMGTTEFLREEAHPFCIQERGGQACQDRDGTARADGLAFGTYLHGLFDHDDFRRTILNALREHKGLASLPVTLNARREKEKAYDRLAVTVREALDMQKLKAIMAECAR